MTEWEEWVEAIVTVLGTYVILITVALVSALATILVLMLIFR